jgi:hypothetical protein
MIGKARVASEVHRPALLIPAERKIKFAGLIFCCAPVARIVNIQLEMVI